ncbi:MFS transporter [Paracoccus pacificus]|uniref:Lysosomal dipeptide transporter MFSD1 n=1 Tax=Paracoccus pacificus TaxID=1463598 RepID=A0ABW4RC22_9RHOB
MSAGILFLILGYCLSQFFRACLAVMAPVLQQDIGATPGTLAISSGLWFLTFALMQLPLGQALDRFGPRWTTAGLLAFGGGLGCVVFAMAQGPGAIHLAMALTGIGCSPVLMASYFIFARSYPPQRFGFLAGLIVGFGSLGNLAGAAPLAWSIEAFGWRGTQWGLAIITLVTAAAIAATVRDPERIAHPAQARGLGLTEILRLPGMWVLLALITFAYAPTAGIRGLWAGPYLRDVFGMGTEGIGQVTLAMGIALIVGTFLYDPVDRLTGSRRRTIVLGTGMQLAALLGLCLWPGGGIWPAAILLAATSFFGASYPAIMAHGRTALPPHLIGRGVTLINMFGVGGAGLMQFASRPVYAGAVSPEMPAFAYVAVFALFALPLAIALIMFTMSRHAE